MAKIFAQAGMVPFQQAVNHHQAPIHKGNSISITTGAASAGVALPVDGAGNAYGTYWLVTSAACWWNMSNAAAGTDPAVAAAAGNYLLTPNAPLHIQCPAGTVSINAIQDAAAGHLCIVGIY